MCSTLSTTAKPAAENKVPKASAMQWKNTAWYWCIYANAEENGPPESHQIKISLNITYNKANTPQNVFMILQSPDGNADRCSNANNQD